MSPYHATRAGIARAAIAAAAIALLAGCSSSSRPSTPATSPAQPVSTSAGTPVSTSANSSRASFTANFNSCSVVTQAQAASALGQPTTAGVLGSATVEGGLACVFYGPSAPAPHTPNVAQPDSVRVVVVKGADALTWYNDYKSKVRAQPVNGYGDQAYYDGDASLSVLKGDSYLRIAVAPASAPPSLAAEKQLATAVLPSI